MKKLMKIKNKKKFIITNAILIISVALIVTLLINFKSIKFNVEILKSEENVNLSKVGNNLNLWNETLDDIKLKNKKIEVRADMYSIILNNENLSNDNDVQVSVKHVDKYEKFNDLKILEVEFADNNIVNSIDLDISSMYETAKYLDIYIIDDEDNIELYLKTKDMENKRIQFDLKKDYSKYLIAYIPVEDIKAENNEITLKKNEEIDIKTLIVPENATYKKIIAEFGESSILSINDEMNIKANAEGIQESTLKTDDNNYSKKINFKVLPVPENIELNKQNITIVEGNIFKVTYSVSPETLENKEVNFSSTDEKIAKIDETGKITAVKAGKTKITVSTKEEPSISKEITVTVQKKVFTSAPSVGTSSTEGLTYIKGILVVNKQYTLPSTYNPGVNATAMAQFNVMKQAAANEGISLFIVSGFRSYSTQQSIYTRNITRYGQDYASKISAQAGHSEHQSGLAFDLNSLLTAFADTKEGIWLKNNCYKYGFIIRYPQNKTDKTGYYYEPWHIRYLGTDIATQITNSGLCLEEYLGI